MSAGRSPFQNIQSGQSVWPGNFQGIWLRLIPYFAELGDAIEDAWRGAGGGLARFPAIACHQLERRPPASSASVATILDWFFAARPSVEQSENASFGQPPVKLYQGSDFYIEALFWMSATTSIHQHGFAGAFTPLAGASVCSTFCYALDHQVEPGFSLGTLERAHTELLRPGAVRPIHPGSGLIHQLFHLDRPTVTIVVRTPADPQSLPQLAYLPPGLAMDGLRDDPVVSRQLRLLGVMIDSGVADVEAHAAKILAQPAVAPAYRVLAYLVARGVDSNIIDRLLAVLGRAPAMSSPTVPDSPVEPVAVESVDSASARQLRETRYLLIEGFLADPLRTVAYHYAHRRARLGHGTVDSQVPGTPSFYGDILMDSLLEVATASVEDITGRELAATYSYFRIYKHGDILAAHRDRPACEISLTICLGMNPGAAGPDYVWPLHVRRDDQLEGVAIPCRPGDAIVYHGCEVWHWRDAFAGENQAQVFLHYVDRQGPHAHLELDGRPELALPSTHAKDG